MIEVTDCIDCLRHFNLSGDDETGVTVYCCARAENHERGKWCTWPGEEVSNLSEAVAIAVRHWMGKHDSDL